ncbi:adipokinetic hormone/corazonin-related peptide receptor variant I-like [Neodiprion lecontei]|uniref:Adipokinetic hormone/corazonin-related peptide receptor variant I-like n=1 Tax=Neodiprion lecontei TaxID=441921 RepID=A0ABM3G0W9_NEOLC|nr:adipokinetic hormone/corazonin-related peptide receptor variant I-like [Neodiprion lecontei]
MFGIAAMGNLTVFVTLSRRRHQKSRMSLMMRHLAAADLVVTFLTIPLEVSWLLAARWMAENSACHFFLALQAFGLYLSRNVLICVSLDRYLAIFHPQNVSDALRRGKIMLTVAWICSLIYALPPVRSLLLELLYQVGISGSDDISTVGMETSRMPKISTIKRTKDTTLRVTIAVVTAFVICWTPYVVLTLW